MDCIRVLIVDDHRLFRQGLASLLSSEAGFEVIGEAASRKEALRLVSERRPDVALLDLAMPDVVGSELIEQVKACVPAPAVIVLTASEDSADLLRAVRAGAKGYVVKNADADILFNAIRKVHNGGAALCDTSMPRVLDILRGLPIRSAPGGALTAREQEVRALMLEGRNNAQIAALLVVSENTVKTHVSHILEKLGVHSRSELLTAGESSVSRY